eukprot:6865944-Karenia_brevis.AAC.1
MRHASPSNSIIRKHSPSFPITVQTSQSLSTVLHYKYGYRLQPGAGWCPGDVGAGGAATRIKGHCPGEVREQGLHM